MEVRELAESFNQMAANIERASYLKKKLTQDVSHELRNPVTSLKGYLEAFEDGVLISNREHIGYALQEVERLEHLIQDLHRLSLVDFQQAEVEKREVDLRELGNKLVAAVSPLVEKNGISFSYQLPPNKLFVMGDEKLLFAAVKNLLHNALDYTDSGCVIELTITTRENNNGLDYAVIEISDTGQGIPADKLDYIFERFYRADESRDRKTGGSGLGLALVREWTRAMDGEIQVESSPGEGTTFRLVFPACECQANS